MTLAKLAIGAAMALTATISVASAQPYPPPPPPGAVIVGPPPPPGWAGPHYYWRGRHWHHRRWYYDRWHHGYWRYY